MSGGQESTGSDIVTLEPGAGLKLGMSAAHGKPYSSGSNSIGLDRELEWLAVSGVLGIRCAIEALLDQQLSGCLVIIT